MKKLKYLLVIFGFMLCMIPNVNAELNFDYEFEITKRTYDDLPFSNWYAVNEVATYDNRNYVKIYGTNANIHNLPRYLYLIYCGTGTINFETTSVSTGDISNDGATWGSSCTLANGYEGTYRLNRWTIKDWGDLSASGIYEYGVIWSVRIHNTLGYNVYLDMESVFLSNELIQDFSSDALLTEILAQNSNLKNSLNEVKSNTSQTNNKLDETNNKLDETNDQLGEVNDNITNDDVGGVDSAFDSFDSFISENSTITQLITMPITLYTSILNGIQSTCQPFVLGNLFGTNLTLPCINISNYIGSNLWTMIDIIISGFAIFSISKKLIKIFNNFSTMKEGDVIDD